MNLIPKTRTEEEKKSFPVPAKSFSDQVTENMQKVAEMSDEELSQIIANYRVSHSDYSLQQAASRTLRSRKVATPVYTEQDLH